MIFNVQQPPAISFNGKVQGPHGYEATTDGLTDKYIQANITYGIRSFADRDTLELTETANGQSTKLNGVMSNRIINLIAEKLKQSKQIYDSDSCDSGKKAYEIPESQQDRKFEASVDFKEIKFSYEYPDGEKFVWTYTPEDDTRKPDKGARLAPSFENSCQYLLNLFKEVTGQR